VLRIMPPIEPTDVDEDLRRIVALYAEVRGRR
jgi:hypothetical protein